MTVTLSQDTYEAILDDIKKLRERNVALEKKAQLFDEIFNAVNAHYVEYPEDWMVEVLKVVRNYEEANRD